MASTQSEWTDIIWLSDNDSRIPDKWRSKYFAQTKPAEHWKQKVNDPVNAGRIHESIEMFDVLGKYSIGLRAFPPAAEEEILWNNRAYNNTFLSFCVPPAYNASW
jgi:hypothetical protein